MLAHRREVRCGEQAFCGRSRRVGGDVRPQNEGVGRGADGRVGQHGRVDAPGDVVEAVLAPLVERGDELYLGEAVTQRAHMLQTAAVGLAEGAGDALVVAALLHDVGHLVDPGAAEALDHGRDAAHEEVGARWLARWFGPEVTEPVRLHVAAKRLLAAEDPAYRAALSPASTRSLALQGGPMTEAEAAAFRARPHAEAALRLRRWDDHGKDPSLSVPGLDAHRGRVRAVVAVHGAVAR